MSGWNKSHNNGGTDNRLACIDKVCLDIVDLCLLCIIFIAPLFFGGRHPLGLSILICLSSVTSIFWAIHLVLHKKTYWPGTWEIFLAILVFSIVFIQIIPLSPELIDLLSPRNTKLLPLWSKDFTFGRWQTLSLYPSTTKIAIAALVSYILLFFVVVGRINNKEDIKFWIRMLAISTVGMASFGIIQYLTSNGLYFWFHEVPYCDTSNATKAGFTCKNHFAHFLILGVPLLIAWAIETKNSPNEFPIRSNRFAFSNIRSDLVFFVSLAIVVIAVLLSFSRGGYLLLAITVSLSILAFTRLKLISGNFFYAILLIGAVALGMLSTSTYDRLSSRVADFASNSFDEIDSYSARSRIWKANINAIKEGGLFGSGAATHREIYPIYIDKAVDREYTHAENGPLQIATENGWLGISITVLIILTFGYYCWNSIRHTKAKSDLVFAIAITISLLASIIHSLFDFVWFIPSCLTFVLILSAIAFRFSQISKTNPAPAILKYKAFNYAFICLVFIVCTYISSITIGPATAALHWDRYLIEANATKKDYYQELQSNNILEDKTTLLISRIENQIFHLRNTITYDPNFARAHIRIARMYLQLFNELQKKSYNAMHIEQIRDAAIASQFSSAADQKEWLKQALGNNAQLLYLAYNHTRKALSLNPLQGEGYLYLARLCFLESNQPHTILAYIDQCLQVRPLDNSIMFEIGKQMMLLGQFDEALEMWKQAYRYPGIQQLKIMKILADRVPAESFLQFFQPEWYTLHSLWKRYRSNGSTEDSKAILNYTLQLVSSNAQQLNAQQAAKIWYIMAAISTDLEEFDQALKFINTAFGLEANNYQIRLKLAQINLHVKRYKEAEEHFRWCLTRKGDDAYLNKMILSSQKKEEIASLPLLNKF